MNWIEKLLQMQAKLAEHGFKDVVERITNTQMVLGSPGEMYLEVMNELVIIRKERPEVWKLIEPENTELLEYGRSLNYFNPKL